MAISQVEFVDLPSSIHFQILEYLDYKDFVNCSKTCHRLLELCENDVYWKKLYRHYWDDNFMPSNDKTWKEAFVEEYQDKKMYIHFYKKVKLAWEVIKNTMDQIDPAIASSLLGGMSEAELDKFEIENRISLPDNLRCIYRFHRGQIKGQRNGIFGVVQNYNYFRSESLLPLKVIKTGVGVPCVAVTGNENVRMLCLLEDKPPLESGNLVTLSPPTSRSFLILANSFLDYFLDYAKKLEEKYFPIIDERVYRFYKDPSSVALSYDVKVDVMTAFLQELSNDSYVYAYLVRFTMDKNVPQRMTCQLKTRHWEVFEGDSVRVVDGPGVIGLTPIFRPGTEFSYISCIKSQVPKTSMKGYYTVTNLESGISYDLAIPEFHMEAGPIVTLEDF